MPRESKVEKVTGEKPVQEEIKEEIKGEINVKKAEKVDKKVGTEEHKINKEDKRETEKKEKCGSVSHPYNNHPLRMPTLPVGTVHINHNTMEKLIKKRVAKTVGDKMSEGYVLLSVSQYEKYERMAETYQQRTQYLAEKSYQIVDMKYGTVTTLLEGETKIGIDMNFADLLINGSLAVSRKHAVLTLQGGKLTVRDIGSTNHTFINDVRITDNVDVEVNDGNIITFADRKFRIQVI